METHFLLGNDQKQKINVIKIHKNTDISEFLSIPRFLNMICVSCRVVIMAV